MKKANKLTFILLISFLSVLALSSCKLKAEQASLTTRFEIIDSLIYENLFKDALTELKRTEKVCYDSWSYLGVYKRYLQLGETTSAEKTIKNALKKNSKNPELIAAYSVFLLRQDRLDEALKLSEPLAGTKYGSIFSEAILRDISREMTPEYYKDQKYYSIYLDAYKSSQNPVWIRNCAVFNLKNGQFDNAASLLPAYYTNTEDAYFWALVLYDSGKYYEAAHALNAASRFLSGYSINKTDSKKDKITQVKISALQSDAYMAASDFESAEEIRQTLINEKKNLENLSDEDESLMQILYVNSAVYALNNERNNDAADMLLFAVDRWPTFSPAIILYSDFAFNSNVQREEDEEQAALRKAGLASLEMERYDSRIKIPLSDALYRLDSALKENNDPKLYIKRLDLKYKINNEYSVKEKTADLWNLLEEAYKKEDKYEQLLIQYVISYLLQTKQTDDAFTLFQKYITSTYSFDEKEDFWKQFERNLASVDVKLAEFGAWFAADKKMIDEAVRLYEYCVYESSGLLAEGVVAPTATTETCMNLADIYYTIGKSKKALDLYGKAAGRESNKYIRSEIFYRIACIYVAQGDNKSALKAAEFSSSLYPDNARASLLKSRLKK